jgi:hypothetical protein
MLTEKKKAKIVEIATKGGIGADVFGDYDVKTIKAEVKRYQAKTKALEKIIAIIAPPKPVAKIA